MMCLWASYKKKIFLASLNSMTKGVGSPACLGLPPVVKDGYPEVLLGPDPRPVVAVLSGHEEVAQGAQVIPLGKAGRGVVPLDGPDGGGRCEEAVHPVGLDDSEKLARIRCPYEWMFHGLDRVPNRSLIQAFLDLSDPDA
jgi:hypothetical protein